MVVHINWIRVCVVGGVIRLLVGNHYVIEAFVIYHNVMAITELAYWNCSSS